MVIDTSLNGTYVNSRKISRAVLRPNDAIRLGKRRVNEGSCTRYQLLFMTVQSPPSKSLSSRANADVDILRLALRCSICKDFLVFPAEVSPCHHIFCSSCIESFTLNDSSDCCPYCDTRLNSYKLRTKYNFVNILDKAMKIVLSPYELKLYTERFLGRKRELLDRQDKLSTLRGKQEELFQSMSDPFLSISQSWSPYEKLKFRNGISKYPIGEARELYCWMVQLTEDWVLKQANQTDVSIALSNLDLGGEEDALIRFIHGKKQLPN